MPIYEQGYRRYEARGPLRAIRFWPITREALRLLLSKKAFLALLALSWVQLLFRVIQIWIVTEYPQAGRVLPVDGRLFGNFLDFQVRFCVLMTIFGGAGLVANDLRTGAILVYLSRPLTRRDYIVGKLAVLLALNLFLTLVPGLLLYLVGLGLAPELYAKWELFWISPAVVLHSLIISFSISLLSLAVSALSRNARVAGLAFFGVFAGLEMVRLVVALMSRSPWAGLLSLQTDIRVLGAWLFGLTLRRAENVPPLAAALVLLAVAALCLLLLRWRVRAVEIVR